MSGVPVTTHRYSVRHRSYYDSILMVHRKQWWIWDKVDHAWIQGGIPQQQLENLAKQWNKEGRPK